MAVVVDQRLVAESLDLDAWSGCTERSRAHVHAGDALDLGAHRREFGRRFAQTQRPGGRAARRAQPGRHAAAERRAGGRDQREPGMVQKLAALHGVPLHPVCGRQSAPGRRMMHRSAARIAGGVRAKA
jgi:hypothetical protein